MAPRPVFSEEQSDFLRNRIAEFLEEQRTGIVRVFCNRTHKEFLRRWPVEDVAERKKLRVQIEQWFYNRVRSKKTAGTKKHGPVITLIPKRSMQPSQAFHSLYKDELRPILDQVYKTYVDGLAEGKSASNRFGFDNEVVRQIYSRVTDPDIRERVENYRLRQVESDGTDEDQRRKEQEAAVKRLPKTCQVVADAIEREAGWYTTILVGGRDPVTGGALAYVYHFGKNQSGEEWGDLPGWDDIQNSWECFVEECFPLEKPCQTSSERVQDTVPSPKAQKSRSNNNTMRRKANADVAPSLAQPATQATSTTKAVSSSKSALTDTILGLLNTHGDVLQNIGAGDVRLSNLNQEGESSENEETMDVPAEESEETAAKQSGPSKQKSKINALQSESREIIEHCSRDVLEDESEDEIEHDPREASTSKPKVQTNTDTMPAAKRSGPSKKTSKIDLLSLAKKHKDILRTVGMKADRPHNTSLQQERESESEDEETMERDFQDVVRDDEVENNGLDMSTSKPEANVGASTQAVPKRSGRPKKASKADLVGQGRGVLVPSNSGAGESSFTDDDEVEYVEDDWQGISQGDEERIGEKVDDNDNSEDHRSADKQRGFLAHHPAVTATQSVPESPALIQSQSDLRKTGVSLDMPIFFREAATYLRGISQEQHWLDLVEVWLKLEEKFGYTEDAGRLPKGSRPEEIGLWMQNARKYTRSPSLAGGTLKLYAERWKLWWAELQPRWRNTKVWPFERKSGSWEVLLKVGKNGVYVVVLSLAWWMSAISKNSSSKKQRDEFLALLDDVNWVFSQLISPMAPAPPSPDRSERKRSHDQLPKPTPKRRKRA